MSQRNETNWPTRPLSAEEEAEHRRRRIEDEPPMGAMGSDGKVRVFRPGEQPPPIKVVPELPVEEVDDDLPTD